MPYISEEERAELDGKIWELSQAILDPKTAIVNPNDFSHFLGRLNYCFTRIIMTVMGDVRYNKIAMATGVLENVKQELYRRVAGPYEDSKVMQCGDVPEYKKWS